MKKKTLHFNPSDLRTYVYDNNKKVYNTGRINLQKIFKLHLLGGKCQGLVL